MSQRLLLKIVCLLIVVTSAVAVSLKGRTKGNAQEPTAAKDRKGCDQGNGGLILPSGFCASVFADNIGRARHLTVAPNGDVYVNTWSSSYTELKNAPGGYVVALRDTNRDGKAEQAGFLVAFVPFETAKPAGRYEEFATGFAGGSAPANPAEAPHRPMGLAVGPDGALYVSDDVKGRIWRITYVGGV